MFKNKTKTLRPSAILQIECVSLDNSSSIKPFPMWLWCLPSYTVYVAETNYLHRIWKPTIDDLRSFYIEGSEATIFSEVLVGRVTLGPFCSQWHIKWYQTLEFDDKAHPETRFQIFFFFFLLLPSIMLQPSKGVNDSFVLWKK